MLQEELIQQQQNNIAEEFIITLGIKHRLWLRKLVKRLIYRPTRRFAELTVQIDQQIVDFGLRTAARNLLSNFVPRVNVQFLHDFPTGGPVIIASNHPGAYDSLAIVSQQPREDIKIIVSGVPFLKNLPHAGFHFIYATDDPHERMSAFRASLRHLKNGGAILLFATGTIDPDPAFMQDADKSIEAWSSSLEIFLDKVPEVRVIPTIVSGILEPGYYNHPLARLRSKRFDRQKLAEFLMIIQIIRGKTQLKTIPHVCFGNPIHPGMFNQSAQVGARLQWIIQAAKEQLTASQAFTWSVNHSQKTG